jgi:hypothetical protein
VVLVQADGVNAERLQRGLRGLPQMGGRAVDLPGAVAGADVAALGRDQHVAGVARVSGQGLGDQPFVVTGLAGVHVIRIRGVDERDACVKGRVDGPDGAVLLGPALDRHRHPA